MTSIHALLAATTLATATFAASAAPPTEQVHHRSVNIKDVNVFYREAGPETAPKVLLLHGFGASSYMFRELIPQLAEKYHVIAPDLPGFGQTNVLPGKSFAYSFDNLASVIDAFTVAKGMDQYAMYVFDYGAPVGWRLAVKNPQKITAIVSQNGNAYEEGLSEGWADMRKAWANPTPANREALRRFNTYEMIKWQYTEGVKDTSVIAPEAYQLAHAAVERIGVEAQMDLLLDYGQNIKQYSALHDFFRRYQPPTLAIWGANDPFFIPAGANAYKRDNPKAEVQFLDTGHFAIETHGKEIADAMVEFLDRSIQRPMSSLDGKNLAATVASNTQGKSSFVQSASTIVTKDNVQLYYKDWGPRDGKVVMFSHGWPLNSDSWESQMMFLASNGYRVIAHDRRGHGRSSQPWHGNDMDHYADDLSAMIEALKLKRVTLVGFSTGGGEVARYIGRHGTRRVEKAVLVAGVPPLMLKTESNPGGLPMSVFDGLRQASLENRSQLYLDIASGPFFGFNREGAKPSQGLIQSFWVQGMQAGHKNTYDSIAAFSATDFREDLKKFNIPTLIIHGDDDQIVPVDASAKASAAQIKGSTLIVYPGAPHGLADTHKDRLNQDLLNFLKR